MDHLSKFGSMIVVLNLIYFSRITGSYAGDMANPRKVSFENIHTNLTHANQILSPLETSFSTFPISDVPVYEITTKSFPTATDNLRKQRRKKLKKKRRRRRKGNPMMGIFLQQPDENGSETVTSQASLKRKIRKRKRKSKKRRRKTKENANILEIVTARVSGLQSSEATFNKSAIYGIMKILNENPESSLDELKHFYTNTTLNFSSNGFSMENSVDSANEKQISSGIIVSSLLANEKIQQPASAKQKTKKRRRKHRKRRRKLKPRNGKILEIYTSKEQLPPVKFESNSTALYAVIKNSPNFHGNNTFSSRGFWLENLVAPTSPTDIANRFFTSGNRTVDKYGKYNRCRKNRGRCAHICNPEGSSKCSCLEGFFLAKDRSSCYDINECQINNGGCEIKCINTLGSYECQCPKGLRIADDLKSCEDVNECLLRNGHGPCQDTCDNTYGSYKCSCARLNGTKLSDNGYSCEDVNECSKDNGGCSHECINTMGRAFCNCPYGLELSSDWKTCQDINECENEDIRISCEDDCINTLGSYRCVGLSDFQNDQPSVNVACNPLFPPTKGFITCSAKGAHRSYTQDGRERIANSPGTVCEVVCPIGFRMSGEYLVTCSLHGQWEGRQDGECKRAPPPKLQCPPSKHFKIERGVDKILVEFPSPITEINWKYVKSNPPWAKDLMKILRRGTHNINFTVRDPSTKMFSSCSFDITVSSN